MSARESLCEDAEKDPAVVGFRLGMDAAIMQARAGNLRIARAPWEKPEHPRSFPIRPWAITRLAWRSWWREKRHG